MLAGSHGSGDAGPKVLEGGVRYPASFTSEQSFGENLGSYGKGELLVRYRESAHSIRGSGGFGSSVGSSGGLAPTFGVRDKAQVAKTQSMVFCARAASAFLASFSGAGCHPTGPACFARAHTQRPAQAAAV